MSPVFLGSSPRMRGSLPALPAITTSYGIIPAHAGLTRRRVRDTAERGDHPRACGAHAALALLSSSRLGSSPRMRGSLEDIEWIDASEGIIPAHAGLTRSTRLVAAASWDHPRACGAHDVDGNKTSMSTGSSPRMRGSPRDRDRAALLKGIIPAHAGLTITSSRA